MLKISEASVKGLECEFQIEDRDRAVLCAAVKQEWFDCLQRLMESEIRRLNIALINTQSNDTAGILANHAVAKGAGMFYAGFMQRLIDLLNIEQYNAAGIGTMANPEVPPYITEIESFEPEKQ